MRKLIDKYHSYSDLLFLIFISIGFFVLMSFDINSWYYSAIGDEYSGFYLARDILYKNVSISIIPSNSTLSIFSQIGFAPVAYSLYQALIMKIFGINHTGWIMSSIIIVILSFWFFYFFVKDSFGKTIAFLSLFVLASSHYLWAFTHLAYWNVNAIFPVIASFFFFFRGLKQKKRILFFLAGIFSGLGFYTFYSSRVTIFILTLFLLLNLKSSLREKNNIIIFFTGFLILFIPFILINKDTIINLMFSHSLVSSKNFPGDQRLQFFFTNLINSFTAFYQSSISQHFVSGSLVDLATAVLFSLGLILLFFSIYKHYFILIWFFIALIVTGGFSEYKTTPITRLLFLLPVTSLLVGYSLDKIFVFLKKSLSIYVSLLIIIVILTTILLSNIHRFYIVTPSKMDLTPEAITIGAMQNFKSCQSKATIFFRYADPVLRPALESYNLLNSTKLITDPMKIHQMDLEKEQCIIFSQPQEDKDVTELISLLSKSQRFSRIDFFSPARNRYVVVFFEEHSMIDTMNLY